MASDECALALHVLIMQARAAAAVDRTNAASEWLLQALARHVTGICAKVARAVELSGKRLDDAAEDADANAKLAWAALLGHAAHSALDAAPPPVFAFEHQVDWLVLPIAQLNLADSDVFSLHRVFSADFDAARTSISGQGLTAFDPSDGPEARQQNIIRILPYDVDGNVAEWVTTTDIGLELVSHGACNATTLSYEVTADRDGWHVVYCIGVQPDNVGVNLYICKALVWKSLVRADTPLSAAKRAQNIKAKRVVAIATALSTHADVQEDVCNAMYHCIYFGGGAEGARKVLVAGGHRVAITALGAFSTNAEVLYEACYALFRIFYYGGVDAKAAVCAVDDTLMDKLRRASAVLRAAGLFEDPAAEVRDFLQ